MSDKAFFGKTILVAGGTRGIGFDVSNALINAGAYCFILGRNEADGAAAVEQLGSSSRFIQVDVSDEGAVDKAFDVIKTEKGGIDGAVNNAGVTTKRSSVSELDLTEWRRVLEINLVGPLLLMSREIQILGQREGGAIVNVSSCGGIAGQPRQSAYSTSKAGLNMLTQVAAIECAKPSVGFSIRINAVCPGPTLGGMNTDERLKANPESTAEKIASTAMKRFAQPAEVTAAILWLLSNQASYVTGALLPVDGGFTAGKF